MISHIFAKTFKPRHIQIHSPPEILFEISIVRIITQSEMTITFEVWRTKHDACSEKSNLIALWKAIIAK